MPACMTDAGHFRLINTDRKDLKWHWLKHSHFTKLEFPPNIYQAFNWPYLLLLQTSNVSNTLLVLRWCWTASLITTDDLVQTLSVWDMFQVFTQLFLCSTVLTLHPNDYYDNEDASIHQGSMPTLHVFLSPINTSITIQTHSSHYSVLRLLMSFLF